MSRDKESLKSPKERPVCPLVFALRRSGVSQVEVASPGYSLLLASRHRQLESARACLVSLDSLAHIHGPICWCYALYGPPPPPKSPLKFPKVRRSANQF